jgi:hypothetical protein
MLIACSQNQVHLEMINVSLKLVSDTFYGWEKQQFSDVKLKNVKRPLLNLVLTNVQNAVSDESWKYKNMFRTNKFHIAVLISITVKNILLQKLLKSQNFVLINIFHMLIPIVLTWNISIVVGIPGLYLAGTKNLPFLCCSLLSSVIPVMYVDGKWDRQLVLDPISLLIHHLYSSLHFLFDAVNWC